MQGGARGGRHGDRFLKEDCQGDMPTETVVWELENGTGHDHYLDHLDV